MKRFLMVLALCAAHASAAENDGYTINFVSDYFPATADNIDKHMWAANAEKTGAPPFFVIFHRARCKYPASNVLPKTGAYERRAVIHLEQGGAPTKVIGQGCWRADLDQKTVRYTGHAGAVFNTDKTGKTLTVPWDKLFNAELAD